VEQSSSSEYNPRIREIPSSERPRERLRDLGANALTTAELLAIVLRTGSASQSVLNLASSLLARHGGLGGLARMAFADLVREKGVGEAKAAELRATFELARRLNALQPEERPLVRSPEDIYNLLGGEMEVLDQEHLRVVLLTTRTQIMAVNEVYKGNVSSAIVRVAEVMREPVRHNAPCFVIVHNHPSGDPAPSPDDVHLTKMVLEACKILDVELLDHVIIGDHRFLSMKSLGLGFPA
jgi:DNA repair protein RadC